MDNTILKWDKRFLEIAAVVKSWSKDPSTKIGCVIVGPDGEIRSTGFNGFPRNVYDNEARLAADLNYRIQRPVKYFFTEHAERNAIYNCVRNGISTMNCILYMDGTRTGGPPCADCTRACIQAGIKEIVVRDGEIDPNAGLSGWRDGDKFSLEMLKEAGIIHRPIIINE